ncbi:AKAP7 2'5' RNA ligase-like domain-containing protein [Cytidiella melzeri]|nr:AKAP7 2'5' RNA ligase-like domain-containing protein [Cytidiella melzeri]
MSYSANTNAPPAEARPQEERPVDRGRGGRPASRGRGFKNPHAATQTDRVVPGNATPNADGGRAEGKQPRPTHFLSLPLGHHPELRARVAAFTEALLNHSPKISGLDHKIVVSPRRMHITLGVMHLTESDDIVVTAPPVAARARGGSRGQTNNVLPQPRVKSVRSAIELLNALRPSIMDMLAGEDLRVGLNLMDIMKPDRGDLSKAHIMWAGPSYEDEQAKRLKRVCEFVHQEFKNAGFVIDERRPLKLHCTVINTSHRRGPRQPFSYADIITSNAFRSIETRQAVTRTNDTISPPQPLRGENPIAVDLGECAVDELQICKMGSWGPEGEYVAVGKISLR